MGLGEASALSGISTGSAVATLLITQLNAVFVGQALDRLGEAQALNFLHKLENVAARSAAEAMIKALSRADIKRRRFLVVERAQAFAGAATGVAESDILLDDLVDTGAFADDLNVLVLDQPGHGTKSRRAGGQPTRGRRRR